MRSTPFIALLVLAFAQPVHAEQVDQQMRQQVISIVAQYVDALNKGDGQTWVALFGPNPINIGPSGKLTTADQLLGAMETYRQVGLAITATVENVELLFGGQGIVATASYSGTYNDPSMQQIQGNFLFVLEHAGNGWKIHASSSSRSLPAPSSQPTGTGTGTGKGFMQLARSGEEVLQNLNRRRAEPFAHGPIQ